MLNDLDLLLRIKAEAYTLEALLQSWGVSAQSRRQTGLSTGMVVGRYYLVAYLRSINVSFYEQNVIDYLGPFIPIFASRKKRKVDDELKTHRRQTPFYFVLPAFVLQEVWPSRREWRWHPAVRVTQTVMRDRLQQEQTQGGWKRSRRGHALIPYHSGCSGKVLQPQEGWG